LFFRFVLLYRFALQLCIVVQEQARQSKQQQEDAAGATDEGATGISAEGENALDGLEGDISDEEIWEQLDDEEVAAVPARTTEGNQQAAISGRHEGSARLQ
jgi:hypothetical protein